MISIKLPKPIFTDEEFRKAVDNVFPVKFDTISFSTRLKDEYLVHDETRVKDVIEEIEAGKGVKPGPVIKAAPGATKRKVILEDE